MEVIIDANQPRSLWSRAAEYRDHHTLLKHLIVKEWKVRYRNAATSILWALAQPMLPALILGYIFSRSLSPEQGNVPYFLFLTAGLVPWSYLTLSISTGAGSFVGNSSILTKVYFPRGILPAASVLAMALEFVGGCLVLVILTAAAGFRPWLGWLAIPILCCVTAAVAFFISLGMASLGVLYRDIRHALPFLLQVWMYATPVMWAPELVPERFRWVLGLNPMTEVVLGFRWALFGMPVDPKLMLLSAATAVVVSVV